MLPRRVVAAVSVVVWLVAGCAGSSTGPADARPSATSTSASPTTSTAFVLPEGKDDLSVSPGLVRSPGSFTPAVTVRLADEWTSVHRGADAFDLGQPDPERDAPLVAVVLAGSSDAPDDAIALIRRAAHRAGAQTKKLRVDIGNAEAEALDVTGGKGQVFTSSEGTIALDAAPGQRLRAFGLDVNGRTLVALVLVPDGRRWAVAWRQARQLVGSLRPA